MTQVYLSKSVTFSTTGMTISTWGIDGWRIRNNSDLTKITITVSVSGYVSPEALSSGLSPVQGNRYVYRLSSVNFSSGTDLTSVSLTDIYNAILNYITTNVKDPLSGATLVSI